MGKNSIKSLSLTAFVGLFAVYSFTAYKFKIGSISSAGIVIKYSKRGLASNNLTCFRTSNAIDETVVDRLNGNDCIHHTSSQELENGDIEYTVTAYYKGFTSSGTHVVSAAEVAADDKHNDEFITGLVTSSIAKFNAAPAPTETASAAVEADTNTSSQSDARPTPNDEANPASAAVDEDAQADISIPAVDGPAGRPEVTMLSSEDSPAQDNGDESENSESSDIDEEILMEAIEEYAQFKIDYNACQNDDEKLAELINEYESAIIGYLEDVDEYESSDEEETPFSKLSTRKMEKFETFVSEVEGLSASSTSESDRAAQPSQDQLTCLVSRSSEISNHELQFDHYVQNIQPHLRQEMQSASIDELSAFQTALNDGNAQISRLAQTNPYITGSIQSDFIGAQATKHLEENSKLIAAAQSLPEPQRTMRLQELQQSNIQIQANLTSSLAAISQSNPLLADHIGVSGGYWNQQIETLAPFTVGISTVGSTTANTNTVIENNGDNHYAQLQEMYERIRKAKKGTGSSRSGAIIERGQYNANANAYRGDSVPQIGDAVGNRSIN